MSKIFKNLTFWVFIAALIGYFSSQLIGESQWVTHPQESYFYQIILLLKSSFINALKMMIAPIIFFSLLGGILNIGEISKLRTMGRVTVTYYLGTTAIAILIGLICVFFIHPWRSSDFQMEVQTKNLTHQNYKEPQKMIDQNSDSIILVAKGVLDKAFVNPFKAVAEGNILAIVTSALFIGLSLLSLSIKDSPLSKIVNDLNLVINKILHWIIKFTPLGVFAIAFDFQLKTNSTVLTHILSFCILVFGATMLHGLIILPCLSWYFAKVHPLDFFKKAARPLLVAFSTSSSSATLPISMQTCEEEFGVSEGVSGFVFPLGATMNMDGTALFEGIAAIFLADLYGIELSVVSTFSIFLMSMLSSIGAPGMPSASMSGMQMVLLAAGIPLEAIGILIVIDKPLDTFRTAVNVEGDMIGAIITQKYIKYE